MFNFEEKSHDVALKEAISNTFITMSGLDASSPEYAAAADQAVKLMELLKKINPSWRPSPDAVIGVLGTIATAFLVLNFEKLGVITSKAFTFIGKTMK